MEVNGGRTTKMEREAKGGVQGGKGGREGVKRRNRREDTERRKAVASVPTNINILQQRKMLCWHHIP